MEFLNVLGANVGALMIIFFTIYYCLENKRYLNKRKEEMNESK